MENEGVPLSELTSGNTFKSQFHKQLTDQKNKTKEHDTNELLTKIDKTIHSNFPDKSGSTSSSAMNLRNGLEKVMTEEKNKSTRQNVDTLFLKFAVEIEKERATLQKSEKGQEFLVKTLNYIKSFFNSGMIHDWLQTKADTAEQKLGGTRTQLDKIDELEKDILESPVEDQPSYGLN